MHYDVDGDAVEVYTQVFFGHEKWKLGILRSKIDQIQGKFSLQAASGIVDGHLNQDMYYALFAYCILSGQVISELSTRKELRKQIAHAPD